MVLYKTRSHVYVRWIFLRLVSICFFAAFFSIAVQIVGLYGEHGILPIKPTLSTIEHRLGLDSCVNFPSVFWCNSSDSFMQTVCWAGVGLSVLAFCGFFTGPILAVLWFLYLSIVSVGQAFMSFQWDFLLLETAFLAVWFAPWGLRELHPFEREKFENQKEVSYFFLWLLRLLCFKLMMFSGICKVTSMDYPGDPNTWRTLMAMTYHYETQPLPTPLAWLAQKLPVFIQQLSTIIMLFIELVLPALLLTFTRQARLVAAAAFLLLMIMIMFTGNYAFFNILTIALSITLLDDSALCAVLPRSLRITYNPPLRRVKNIGWNSMISIIPAVLIGATSIGYLWMMIDRNRHVSEQDISVPFFLQVPVVLAQPLRSFSSYGLFAHMTTSRPEIIVEGSNDEINWLSYEFKYKPGDIKRAPPIVAPHQPRLDWQMWFAALGPSRESPWFDSFVKSLLDGSPEVLALMDKNPFPDKPPKQIRATLYDYHFSDFGSLFSKGEWWKRERTGEFYPPTRREDLRDAYHDPDL